MKEEEKMGGSRRYSN